MAAHGLRVWLLRAGEMAQWGKCEEVGQTAASVEVCNFTVDRVDRWIPEACCLCRLEETTLLTSSRFNKRPFLKANKVKSNRRK